MAESAYHKDYEGFLSDIGLTDKAVQAISYQDDDMIPFPEDYPLIKVGLSAIHGIGMFATEGLTIGQLVAPSMLDGYRTPAGRYINHADDSNCIAVPIDSNMYLISAKPIQKGEEFTVNYRQVLTVNPRVQAVLTESNELITANRLKDLIDSYGFDLSPMTNLQKVEILEWILLKHFTNIKDEFLLRQFIWSGMYLREFSMPKGTLVIGKIHKYTHLFIVTQGDITLMTHEGLKRVQAPYVELTDIGLKRICYMHSDVVCMTINICEETDLEIINKALVQDSDLSWVDNLIQTNTYEVIA